MFGFKPPLSHSANSEIFVRQVNDFEPQFYTLQNGDMLFKLSVI